MYSGLNAFLDAGIYTHYTCEAHNKPPIFALLSFFLGIYVYHLRRVICLFFVTYVLSTIHANRLTGVDFRVPIILISSFTRVLLLLLFFASHKMNHFVFYWMGGFPYSWLVCKRFGHWPPMEFQIDKVSWICASWKTTVAKPKFILFNMHSSARTIKTRTERIESRTGFVARNWHAYSPYKWSFARDKQNKNRNKL